MSDNLLNLESEIEAEVAKTQALEDAMRLINTCPEYRVIKRFDGKFDADEFEGDYQTLLSQGDVIHVLGLDTETSGAKFLEHEVVELGLILAAVRISTGKMVCILDEYNGLEQPERGMTEEARMVNGITDEELEGQSFDEERVKELVRRCDVVVAHNAVFDRTFIEGRFPCFEQRPWVCSFRQVDWDAEVISAKKLDYISYRLGFFYDAHRALVDVAAMLKALNTTLHKSGKTGFAQLIAVKDSELVRLSVDVPFDKKELVKKRGYIWHEALRGYDSHIDKVWFVEVKPENLSDEMKWLFEEIYDHRRYKAIAQAIDGFSRFSVRVSATEEVFH